MIEPQGTLKIGPLPLGYKLNPEKLKRASQSVLPYLFCCFYYTEEFEYFDVIRPYLDIPENPKSLEEIQKELDEKIDILIEQTRRNFYASKLTAERNYEYKFDKIIKNFEYSIKNGSFPPSVKWVMGTGLSATGGGAYMESSFVIKQGSKHQGYYTMGNMRYFKYYMSDKPTAIVKFFMKTCLGLFWVDEKNE